MITAAGVFYLLIADLEHDLLSIISGATQGQDMSLSKFVVGNFCKLLLNYDWLVFYCPASAGEVKFPRRRHGGQ